MPEGGSAERAERPLGLGLCDLLTVEEAARALRMREADARTWLRARGLIRVIPGARTANGMDRERVPWGQVYRLIAEGEAGPEPEPTKGRARAGGGRLPRIPL